MIPLMKSEIPCDPKPKTQPRTAYKIWVFACGLPVKNETAANPIPITERVGSTIVVRFVFKLRRDESRLAKLGSMTNRVVSNPVSSAKAMRLFLFSFK